MPDFYLFCVPGLGMIAVAVLAVAFWRWLSAAEFKWFWAGAGLWAIAVLSKLVFALLSNKGVVSLLQRTLSGPLFLPMTGLYLGTVSAGFEVGLTWLAGRRWKSLGRDTDTAIAVGVGAGAIEALLLGCMTLTTGVSAMAGEDLGEDRAFLLARAAVTPFFLLEAPVGRLIALLGHISTCAIVLLGITDRRLWPVLCGFAIFAIVDGTAAALLLTKVFADRSMWWIDAATLPFNLIGTAALVGYCRRRRNTGVQATTTSAASGGGIASTGLYDDEL